MKHPLASKTLWFNILSAVLLMLEAQVGVLTPLLPPAAAPWLLIGLPIVNIILRVITTQPLAVGEQSKK